MTPIMSIKAQALTLAAVTILTTFASSADTPDPSVGKWVLNAAKSSCDPPPVPKSHVVTIAEAPGGAIHETVDIVDGDGTITHMEFTAARDGKYVPLTGTEYADSVSVTKVDARTTKYVLKKAGKRTDSGTFAVSKDGKTMKGSLSGKDAQGPWKCQFVSDRQ